MTTKGKRVQDNPDHWSDIVGMPDEWDKENIRRIIKNFSEEKFSFTEEDGSVTTMTGEAWIVSEVEDAKESHRQGLDPINEHGLKSKDSDMRVATAMPNVLWARISEAYPTLFKDRKHLTWFVKNFKMFQVPNKF